MGSTQKPWPRCKGKPTKEFQIDDFCQGGLSLGKFIQRITHSNEFLVICRHFDFAAEGRDFELSAAFLGESTSRVVDD